MNTFWYIVVGVVAVVVIAGLGFAWLIGKAGDWQDG